MTSVFYDYIKSKAALTAKEIAQVRAAATFMRLPRKSFLLQPGEICTRYAFVTKGVLRLYRTTADKQEHILRFAVKNWWMSDQHSIETGVVSESYIEAIEDSEVLLWDKATLFALMEEIPAFGLLCKNLTDRNRHTYIERIYAGISASPQEKYDRFQIAYPEIATRVPLHMIASYLGISRKTLTRIRVAGMRKPGISGQAKGGPEK